MENQNLEDKEILYQISPKFNLIYELVMPTGKKIKGTIILLFAFIMLSILVGMGLDNLDVSIASIDVINIFKIVCYIVTILVLIKLILHIVLQYLQYKNITYTFYDEYLIYEDSFLNQHKKSIYYSNIKEIEIRRTVLDRVIGFGIIVVYTNAENDRGNGLVIYGLRNPKESYEIIEKIIHNNTSKDKSIEKIEELKNEDKITEENEEVKVEHVEPLSEGIKKIQK